MVLYRTLCCLPTSIGEHVHLLEQILRHQSQASRRLDTEEMLKVSRKELLTRINGQFGRHRQSALEEIADQVIGTLRTCIPELSLGYFVLNCRCLLWILEIHIVPLHNFSNKNAESRGLSTSTLDQGSWRAMEAIKRIESYGLPEQKLRMFDHLGAPIRYSAWVSGQEQEQEEEDILLRGFGGELHYPGLGIHLSVPGNLFPGFAGEYVSFVTSQSVGEGVILLSFKDIAGPNRWKGVWA